VQSDPILAVHVNAGLHYEKKTLIESAKLFGLVGVETGLKIN
jgi:hypothetical protein